MIEIEKYPCNDSHEAHGRVRYYIELLNANLNGQCYKNCKERDPIDYLDKYGPPGSAEREAYIKYKMPCEKFDSSNLTVAYLTKQNILKS